MKKKYFAILLAAALAATSADTAAFVSAAEVEGENIEFADDTETADEDMSDIAIQNESGADDENEEADEIEISEDADEAGEVDSDAEDFSASEGETEVFGDASEQSDEEKTVVSATITAEPSGYEEWDTWKAETTGVEKVSLFNPEHCSIIFKYSDGSDYTRDYPSYDYRSEENVWYDVKSDMFIEESSDYVHPVRYVAEHYYFVYTTDNGATFHDLKGFIPAAGEYEIRLVDKDTGKLVPGSGYKVTAQSLDSVPTLREGTNQVTEGSWYSFTPEKSGIYHIPQAAQVTTVKQENGNWYQEYLTLSADVTYYIRPVKGCEELEITKVPSVTKVSFVPDKYEKNWAPDESVNWDDLFSGQLTLTDDAQEQKTYTFSDRKPYLDDGHEISFIMKNSDGEEFTYSNYTALKPGKYTYRVKVDDVYSEEHPLTVNLEATRVSTGKSMINADLTGKTIYEFVPQETGFYKFDVSEGWLVSSRYVFYMDNGQAVKVNTMRLDENGKYAYGTQDMLKAGQKYYFTHIDPYDDPDEGPSGEYETVISRYHLDSCELEEKRQEPTCKNAGQISTSCKVHPGEAPDATEILPATGKHVEGAWKVTKAATALTAGTRVKKCTVCGTTVRTETIKKLSPKATLSVAAKKTLPLKLKQTLTVKVSGLANGDSVKSWTSSNKKIATVTSGGKVTGKAAGTATVKVTLKSGYSTWFKVKVQKAAVKTTSINVINKATGKKAAGKITLKCGKKLSFQTTVAPVTSKEKITYTSSNKKVAAVTSKGVVTAKKKGTATITVKSGSKSVKIKITVK